MSPSEPNADPAAVVRDMREQIFTLSPGDIGIASGPGHVHVWTVLMETGYPQAVASLVAVADGTTSLYFSSGGGIIGAGQHAAVRSRTEQFVAGADALTNLFTPATEHPLPGVRRVRFYLRTFHGLLTAEAAEVDLGENRHELSRLFHLGHAVIAAVRAASPTK